MQGIVMGAAQMLAQGFNNCTNLHNRDSATIKRHGLPNRLQTSSYGATKVLSTIPNRKSIIKIVKQDSVEKRPNRTSSYLVPKLKSLLPPKMQWRQPQLLKQHCTRRSILDPTAVPQEEELEVDCAAHTAIENACTTAQEPAAFAFKGWGFVGAGVQLMKKLGLTGGVAVGVQEGAGAAAQPRPAAGPTGAAEPVSITVIGSLPATKACEGLGGLAGRGGSWQLA
ncbi:TPA: hypothetical protein ACH3X1_001387 [Trebouxia sp. C0004]